MNDQELVQKLSGTQTIKAVMALLNVNRAMAVYYLYRLRKKGYLKTKYGSGKRRIYDISKMNRLNGTSYYDLINENSPVKVAPLETYIIYGRKITPEEAIAYAVETKSLRVILASLGLFKKIKHWKNIPKELRRKVGALYDVAKKVMRVRSMPKNFEKPRKDDKKVFIIDGLSSKDFKEIEQKWNVFIPFNKADLEDYR